MKLLVITRVRVDKEQFVLSSINSLTRKGLEVGVLYTRAAGDDDGGGDGVNVVYDGFSEFGNGFQYLCAYLFVRALRLSCALLSPARRRFIDDCAGWERNGRLAGAARAFRFLGAVRRVARFRPDVLHVQFGWNLEYALPIARHLGLPVVLTVHGTDVLRENAWARDTRFDRVKAVVSVSEHLRREADRLLRPLGFDGEMPVVGNAINPCFLAPPVPAPSALRIVCVAALRPLKNHAWLFRALAILKSRGWAFDCELIGEPLAGPDYEDDLARLRRSLEDLGIADRVVLLGRRPPDAVRERLDAATVLVLPSESEGLPVSIGEAQARERAVVASDIAGCREATADGKYGFLVALNDDAGLADAIVSAHATVQDRAPRLAEARAAVIDRFAPERHAERLIAVYEGALSA